MGFDTKTGTPSPGPGLLWLLIPRQLVLGMTDKVLHSGQRDLKPFFSQDSVRSLSDADGAKRF